MKLSDHELGRQPFEHVAHDGRAVPGVDIVGDGETIRQASPTAFGASRVPYDPLTSRRRDGRASHVPVPRR